MKILSQKIKKEGKSWLDDLNNGKGTRIEESMLEKALEKTLELYREIVQKSGTYDGYEYIFINPIKCVLRRLILMGVFLLFCFKKPVSA